MAGEWPDCPHCGREYRYRPDENLEVPPCCGEPFCRARQEWTDEQWLGRALMARASIAAGVRLVTRPLLNEKGEERWIAERVPYEPDDWDMEALTRARRHPVDDKHTLKMFTPFVRAVEEGWLWVCSCGASNGQATKVGAVREWRTHAGYEAAA